MVHTQAKYCGSQVWLQTTWGKLHTQIQQALFFSILPNLKYNHDNTYLTAVKTSWWHTLRGFVWCVWTETDLHHYRTPWWDRCSSHPTENRQNTITYGGTFLQRPPLRVNFNTLRPRQAVFQTKISLSHPEMFWKFISLYNLLLLSTCPGSNLTGPAQFLVVRGD